MAALMLLSGPDCATAYLPPDAIVVRDGQVRTWGIEGHRGFQGAGLDGAGHLWVANHGRLFEDGDQVMVTGAEVEALAFGGEQVRALTWDGRETELVDPVAGERVSVPITQPLVQAALAVNDDGVVALAATAHDDRGRTVPVSAVRVDGAWTALDLDVTIRGGVPLSAAGADRVVLAWNYQGRAGPGVQLFTLYLDGRGLVREDKLDGSASGVTIGGDGQTWFVDEGDGVRVSQVGGCRVPLDAGESGAALTPSDTAVDVVTLQDGQVQQIPVDLDCQPGEPVVLGSGPSYWLPSCYWNSGPSVLASCQQQLQGCK